ncbi:fatty acid--CoA ligase [Novosphingobium sp. Gsoil 351]|uniref:fatty acid--CoA ligase n=1 Tax=Novosphingobium sp. Gsoil 351 TaxID=2675225 RepID=UPI0012B461A8|nr:fatty acid--CoA ligase [Novosphingobium sp. Gsoil 351]QGN54291.1 long-chain-fatty-acid--CoA ligase [Novosphingobium sp. Gsoil 351]
MTEAATALPQALGDLVREHARTQPDTAAFSFGDENLTFGELDAGSNRAAQGLAALGVGKGDRIAYLGKNHPLYFEVLIAAAKLGAVMTPVNWRLAPPEVAYIVNDCQAKVLFVGEGFAEMLDKVRGDFAHVASVIGIDAGDAAFTDYRRWRDGFPATDPLVPVAPEDDALQLYTSGTTGRPKGAVMTHGSIISSRHRDEADLKDWQKPIPGEVTLLAMPCFHISGTGTGIGTIAAGTCSIVLPEYDPTQALDLIARYNISKIFLVPAAIQIMLNHPRVGEVDFSRLKFITYGASPIPLELMRAAMERFGCGFVQMYGMTETSGTIVTLDPEDHVPEGSPRMRSVGKPLPGVEVKIIDGEGNEVPANTVGEIATRSPKNMRGYWNLPDATAATIDTEGWLRTGDAGYFDDDGYLYIHDRVKDMIISGGENVYPAEVENAVYSHPKVADVAVIGVPDAKWGEAVKACVVVKPGETLSEAEVIAHARQHIAGYKCPKSVDFIAALPRNPSGKILRRELRVPYWEGRERAIN